jgi:hypothetical protein
LKTTIATEAGRIVVEASAGRVTSNGHALLPHEAFLVGSELMRAAERADVLAARQRIHFLTPAFRPVMADADAAPL